MLLYKVSLWSKTGVSGLRPGLSHAHASSALSQSLWVLWECVFDSVYMFVVSLRLFIYTQRTALPYCVQVRLFVDR